MEAAILLGLLGVGYALDQNKSETHKTHSIIQPPNIQSSQKTIYDQTNLSDAIKNERQIVVDRVNAASKGSSTMIDSLNMSGRNTL